MDQRRAERRGATRRRSRSTARRAQRDDLEHVRGAGSRAARRSTPTRCARARAARRRRQAFVAGTDISQFRSFEIGRRRPRRTRRRSTRASDDWSRCPCHRSRRRRLRGRAADWRSPPPATCASARPTPSSALPIARTLGNCLSMANYARLVARIGAGAPKKLLFTAEFLAEEARALGFASALLRPEASSRSCDASRGHAPITLRVTKEALRRLRDAGLPAGDDLVAEAYGSEDFKEAVRRSWRSGRRSGAGRRNGGWVGERVGPLQKHGVALVSCLGSRMRPLGRTVE